MIYYNKKSYKDLQNLLPRKINILDIGSRGGADGWLLDINDSLEKTNFDADPNLKQDFTALFDKLEKKNFYFCKDPSQSSFFQPNPIIKDYEDESRRLNYKIIKDIETVTLDSLNIKKNIDLIKIDTQGSEFEIICGALNLIKKNKPLIFLETWSHPIYKKVKHFSEIIIELEKNDYELWGMDDKAAAFRLDVKKHFDKNFSRRRAAGYNLFMVPNIKDIKNLFSKDKLQIYSFIFFLHGYSDWAHFLLENFEEDNFKKQLNKDILKFNKYHKFYYLIYIVKDLVQKLLGKGSLPRYKNFT